MNNQQGGNNQLENICGYSFPGNSLLQFSLVRQQQDVQYKKEYFFFMTCAPGENGQNGRTFNFQNRFTIKMDIDKLASLKNAIDLYAKGHEAVCGQFSIFADNSKSQYSQGSGNKTVHLNKGADQKSGAPQLSLMFSQGGNSFPFVMPVCNALAISDVLKFMIDKALDLEMSRSIIQIANSSIQSNNKNNNNYQNNNNNQPQNNTAPPQQQNNTAPPQQNNQNNVANNFANALDNNGQQNNGTNVPNTADDVPF